jgi:uncharacterized membrane protein YdjX (TVP38/TMEM64 family)
MKTVRVFVAGTLLLALVGWAGWSYAAGGLVHLLLRRDVPAAQKLAGVQADLRSWGVLAPAVYLVAVTIEVVIAPIPGTFLYAPGGALFGGFLGGAVSLAGNVLGAGIACQLTRGFGAGRLPAVQNHALQKLLDVIERRGAWVIFLLRVNPLTSSDLVSYAAGLSAIRPWKVMLGTLFGMAPLCFAQSYAAQEVLRVMPALLYPAIGLCVLYVVGVWWFVTKHSAIAPRPGSPPHVGLHR